MVHINFISRSLLIAAAAVVIPHAASAEDRWSGPYAGITVGIAATHDRLESSATCGAASCYYTNPAPGNNLSNLSSFASGAENKSRATFGGAFGYNWQSEMLVYGLQADYQSFDSDTTVLGVAKIVNPTIAGTSMGAVARVHASRLGMLRARLGLVATPSLMLYATGGLAWTNVQVTNAYADDRASFGATSSGFGAGTSSATKSDLALGLGGEYALDKNWSLSADFVHAAFGSVATTAPVTSPTTTVPAATLDTRGTVSTNLFRAGLAYKF